MIAPKPNTVVIMQPYFLPYRNYYSLISTSNHFIVFDDVQFCRGWQQRNCILFQDGRKEWITVPVMSRRPTLQQICDVLLDNSQPWRRKMLRQIYRAYRTHPHFESIYPCLQSAIDLPCEKLVDFNVRLLHWGCQVMRLPTPQWHWSSCLASKEFGRNERLIFLCKKLQATEYLCGPAAKVYLDEGLFRTEGISVRWHEPIYGHYPQLNRIGFDHFVSVLDLVMNCGPKSVQYVQSFT